MDEQYLESKGWSKLEEDLWQHKSSKFPFTFKVASEFQKVLDKAAETL